MPDSSNNNQSTPPPERSRIAEIVAGVSIGGITILSGIAIYQDKTQTMHVFGVVLPLLGSWMGTVLAFYFSRDNLAAATQSVKDLTQAMTSQDKLKAALVKDKMRPLSQIKFVASDDDTSKISDLSQLGVERILVLDNKSTLRYLIYRAMIDKYLASFAGGTLPTGKTVATLTLKDLIDSDAAAKKLFQGSFAFVPLTATLADAKSAMDKIDKCSDVFVTNTGKSDEPILGWITDNAIIENSRV